jgi:hypothetical protein
VQEGHELETGMEYEHTQKAPLGSLLLGNAGVLLVASWFARGQPPVVAIFVAVAAVLAVAALLCGSLTVRDGGDRLVVRYGPLPLLGTRIRYADITAVQPDRTSLLDGWGIHYVPGRGTTYNLWGFGCAKLSLGKKTVRVGSDDVDGLVAFLRGKIAPDKAPI